MAFFRKGHKQLVWWYSMLFQISERDNLG